MKLINRTGIKLLGFKDLDQLAIEDNVKHSMFIYPDESVSGAFLHFLWMLMGIDGDRKFLAAHVHSVPFFRQCWTSKRWR
jgi:hypothetical protein